MKLIVADKFELPPMKWTYGSMEIVSPMWMAAKKSSGRIYILVHLKVYIRNIMGLMRPFIMTMFFKKTSECLIWQGKREKRKCNELMHVFLGEQNRGIEVLLSTEGINTWLVPLEYYLMCLS